MFEIHDSFELALNITALIPCLIIIILYLNDCSHLKPQNFFKLELMFSLLIYICLNFVKNYKYNNENDRTNSNHENGECNQLKYKIIGLIKSYLEIVNLLFLSSFNCLCYSLLKNKSKGGKGLSLVIILSLISWLMPIYIFILYFFERDQFISKYGVCIFNPEIKKKINFYLIPIIFLVNIIFFIITLKILYSYKKEDEENIERYNKNIKRITLYFISHLIFFASQSIYNSFLFFGIEEQMKYKYYNISYHLALTVLCSICCIENKTREYYNKIMETCFKSEKDENNNIEEEEEEEDEQEEIRIFRE